jgi:hypothetical protein
MDFALLGWIVSILFRKYYFGSFESLDKKQKLSPNPNYIKSFPLESPNCFRGCTARISYHYKRWILTSLWWIRGYSQNDNIVFKKSTWNRSFNSFDTVIEEVATCSGSNKFIWLIDHLINFPTKTGNFFRFTWNWRNANGNGPSHYSFSHWKNE